MWLAASFLTVTRAAICVADFDMSGDWYTGVGPFPLAVFHIVQTGTSLSVSAMPPSGPPTGGMGTIDPMTGAFTIEFPLIDPPFTCSATFAGQISPDGNTFVAPGTVITTSPDCQSFSCACGESDPVELHGSRAPCGNGVVDAGEECDDAQYGFPGSCCALDCTALPAGGTCTSDGNLCTDDVCGAGGVCTHPALPAGTACASDGNLCTDDVCDAGAVCTHPALPDGTACDDGQFCNGEEMDCHGGVCTAGTDPCPLACNESTDQCLTTCPTSPQSCRTAAKSLLSFKIRSDATKNKLLWKWLKGAATSQTEFGDPTVSTEYALCIYAGSASSLAIQTVIPASGAWHAVGSSGYKYDDVAGVVRSIDRILLKGSAENKSKILLKGRGDNLPLVPPPLTDPITIQLYNGRNGLCWGASYAVAQMIRNETDQLKAKTP